MSIFLGMIFCAWVVVLCYQWLERVISRREQRIWAMLSGWRMAIRQQNKAIRRKNKLIYRLRRG